MTRQRWKAEVEPRRWATKPWLRSPAAIAKLWSIEFEQITRSPANRIASLLSALTQLCRPI